MKAWWTPQAHADRRPFLLARARIAAAIRTWFAARDFIEIEPSCLQPSPGADPHVEAFSTQLRSASGERRRLYLHASPEFACKKLLAAGEKKIVFFGRVFRNGEAGALHLPEFTMLEWYRADEPLSAIETDCLELLRVAAHAVSAREFRWRDRTADPAAPAQRLSVEEAFARFADVDLGASLSDDGVGDGAALAQAARGLGLRVTGDDSWSDIFSKILSDKVERQLGIGRPTILCDYPMAEAALARRSARDRRLAERFELYCCGVELANAFGELNDAAEQRARFEADNALRRRVYGEAYPLDEDFLAALALMPEASGCALGFDRLVALACGAERIEQVAWTPMPGQSGT